MMDKVDLVIWTKNGAETLPFVLKRINRVIPSKHVQKRMIVDDKSNDSTREIAESFGWQTISNKGSGISLLNFPPFPFFLFLFIFSFLLLLFTLTMEGVREGGREDRGVVSSLHHLPSG